jgi:hypothetical protein
MTVLDEVLLSKEKSMSLLPVIIRRIFVQAAEKGIASGPRPRIRCINADPRYDAARSSLMPEAACGCDSNNPVTVCVAGDVPVSVPVSVY